MKQYINKIVYNPRKESKVPAFKPQNPQVPTPIQKPVTQPSAVPVIKTPQAKIIEEKQAKVMPPQVQKKEELSGKEKEEKRMTENKPKEETQVISSSKIQEMDITKIVQNIRRYGIMKKAIRYGIVGLGQGGCRVAGEFEKLGYPVLAVNTSEQDLDESPCKNRLQIGQGGAGRDLRIGSKAVDTNQSKIMLEFQKIFGDIEHVIICAGSSGGTGGGGIMKLIEALLNYKVKVGVITTLPLESEDTRSKQNTLSVLNELVKANAAKKISPLLIVDNDKIEKKHPGLSTIEFWNVANSEVVKTFDLFNVLANRSSAFTSFDPMDYRKVVHSGGCMIFGHINIPEGEIKVDTIANAIGDNIDGSLLAEGFNLVEATHAACLIVGKADKLKNLPRVAEDNAFIRLNRLLGSGTVFKGVYAVEQVDNVEVFFMISGLGLPVSRIRKLIESTKVQREHLEKKVVHRTVDDILAELNTEAGSDVETPKAQEPPKPEGA